ncbi:hypothetical protein ACFV30_42590 [Streptomyces sp. NPDC059752]
MSGHAGDARIASRTRPTDIDVFRRSAHRSVPSSLVRAAFTVTA